MASLGNAMMRVLIRVLIVSFVTLLWEGAQNDITVVVLARGVQEHNGNMLLGGFLEHRTAVRNNDHIAVRNNDHIAVRNDDHTAAQKSATELKIT